jgi:hypothetical protein
MDKQRRGAVITGLVLAATAVAIYLFVMAKFIAN